MDGVPGYVSPGTLARVAQRLNLSLAEVDARMSVDDVLDEIDLQAYIADVDNPPAGPPSAKNGRR